VGGRHSRNKGASFEREIGHELTRVLGSFVGTIKRKLGQAREGGNDIDMPPYRIECKRYAKIAVYEWLRQCSVGALLHEKPMVIARADNERTIAIMYLDDLLPAIRAHMEQGPTTPEELR